MKRLAVFCSAGVALVLAAPAQAGISITPRFSLYFDNTEQRQSDLGEASNTEEELAETNAQLREIFGPTANLSAEPSQSAIAANQLVFPMFGLSVTAGGQSTQFTLTGMYGKSNADGLVVETSTQRFEVLDFAAEDIVTTTSQGELEYKRYDVEATVQHRLNETFSVLGGVRYERVEGSGEFDVVSTGSTNIQNLVSTLVGEPIDFELARQQLRGAIRGTSETYSLRAGAAAYVPVTGRLLTYVNGLLHVSHTPAGEAIVSATDLSDGSTFEGPVEDTAETAVGPDLSVGLLYRFSDSVALDLRYRGIFYFPAGGDRSIDDPRVNHGLNVGVTFALGR